MHWYPYSKIQTNHLLLLLVTARALGLLGFVPLILGVFTTLFSSSLGMGFMGAKALGLGITSVAGGLLLFVLSGLLAALVSFEFTYTRKIADK